MRSGVRESVRGEWSGDEDLGSGILQLLYKEYTARCNSIRILNVAVGFDKLKMALLEDLNFIHDNGKIAKDAYQKVVDVPGKKESTLMQLA